MRISSSDLSFEVDAAVDADAGDGAGVGVTVYALVIGCVIWPTARDLSDAETDRNSSEILFKETVISSTFCNS